MALEAFLRAPVQPTESPAKVEAAVHRLFPDARLDRGAWGLEGPARDLSKFRRLIREQRIPDTARGVLLRHQDGGKTRFAVSKQAAAVGRLNFAAREGPLGDIQVELRAGDAAELMRFIDDAAPDTRAWTLEDRGLTEEKLALQDASEASLDAMERATEEADEAEGDPPAGGATDEDRP